MKNISEIGYTSLHLKTDSQQVLHMLKEEEEWPAFIAELEEFDTLKKCFLNFIVSFVPRSLNIRADTLAKGARSRGSSFEAVNSLPPNGSSSATNPFLVIS
ncbi:unnamed protein product [Microthlaspi erraticum]|uniref:RNase H type-1 domain-containing protein n=1 Tax=Microthlaspi erraticum TaxID=1685480 RepID=A0A6D2JBC1_9BRAS|nr:unnamed protein product [Microthlaspi erraticum]